MDEKVLEAIEQKFTELQEKHISEFISKEDYETGIDEIKESLKELTENTEVKEELKKVSEFAEKLSAELDTLKITESNKDITTREDAIKEVIKQVTASDEFKEWVESGSKGSGPKVTVKYTVTGDRTGNDTITTQSSYVRPLVENRAINMRDIIGVMPTDLPYLVFDKVTAWSGNVSELAEEGAATELDFDTAETTVDVKRLAGFVDVSKRAMKSVVWLNAYLNKKLPDKLKRIEDFEILYGDASGNHLDGLVKNATAYTLAGPSFSAGDVSSVATYKSGTMTIVTFAAAHGLKNGYNITFASATEATYNSTFSVNVMSTTEILVDVTYVAEADTSAWTGTTEHALANTVDNAQKADCLMSVRGFLASSEYPLAGHVINPGDGAAMELLKETTDGYMPGKNIQRVGGILYIGGIPCVELNAMPSGYFLSGAFNTAVDLLQFSELTLSFVSDVTYAKANKVMALIEEEILLPIYNPYMFVFGKYVTVAAALETP